MNILASIALIAVFAIYDRRDILAYLKKALFRKRYWWNASTKIDYQVYLLNSVLKVLLFVPFLDLSFYISRVTVKALLSFNGDFAGWPSGTLYLAFFTVIAFLWDDFLRFFHHLLMHKIPWLWRLHKVHHSARVLTPLTLYRTHPLESAMATVRNSLSLGVSAGVFIFFFEAEISIVTLLGVNVFGFVFNFLGSNLRHSHIPLAFGPFEHVFVSPKMHQIHHSRKAEHWEHNYGVSLSIWDRLVGARLLSAQTGAVKSVGLAEVHASALWLHLVAPFRAGKQKGSAGLVLSKFASSYSLQLKPRWRLILPGTPVTGTPRSLTLKSKDSRKDL